MRGIDKQHIPGDTQRNRWSNPGPVRTANTTIFLREGSDGAPAEPRDIGQRKFSQFAQWITDTGRVNEMRIDAAGNVKMFGGYFDLPNGFSAQTPMQAAAIRVSKSGKILEVRPVQDSAAALGSEACAIVIWECGPNGRQCISCTSFGGLTSTSPNSCFMHWTTEPGNEEGWIYCSGDGPLEP